MEQKKIEIVNKTTSAKAQPRFIFRKNKPKKRIDNQQR